MKKTLSAREEACIALRIPKSGNVWLDELIAEAQLRDLTAMMMQSLSTVEMYDITHKQNYGVRLAEAVAEMDDTDMMEKTSYGLAEAGARSVLRVIKLRHPK